MLPVHTCWIADDASGQACRLLDDIAFAGQHEDACAVVGIATDVPDDAREANECGAAHDERICVAVSCLAMMCDDTDCYAFASCYFCNGL
jgi:hypothetical protein